MCKKDRKLNLNLLSIYTKHNVCMSSTLQSLFLSYSKNFLSYSCLNFEKWKKIENIYTGANFNHITKYIDNINCCFNVLTFIMF